MATIEERKTKDGEVHYRVKVRIKGFPAQTETFKRKTDAKLWAKKTEMDILEGRYFMSQSKKRTVREMLERYEEQVLINKPKSKQEGHLKWWIDQLGDYALKEITTPLVAEYRDKLSQGITPQGKKRAPATVKRYLALLSHAFTIAVNEWEWVKENPVLRVAKPKLPRGRVRFLDDDELARLMKACKVSNNPFLYPVVVLGVSTGMRKEEIMSLKWDHVDLDKGRIVLHETKNGEVRAIPVKGLARDLLKEHALRQPFEIGYLFPGKDPSKPIDLRFPWKKALKQASIKDFKFHDLRHCTASYLVMNGASLAEVSEILGHKNLEMVKRYAHLSESHTANVIENMNQKIFGTHS